MIIGGVVLLLLCLCGAAVVYGLAQAGSDSEPDIALPTSRPTFPSEARPTSDPDLGQQQQFVRGDCVVNDGTDDDAELRKVPCGPGTYEVLLKIPFTTDGSECKTLAPTADADYIYDSPLDFADYVLCLRKR